MTRIALLAILFACHWDKALALSAEEVHAALSAAAESEFGSGAGDRIRIEVLDYSRGAPSGGAVRFPLHSLPPAAPDGITVLHGGLYQNGAPPAPVWARVRMTQLASAVVAREDINPRVPISPDQVEMRDVWLAFPAPARVGTLSTGRLQGARLRRGVRAGEVLPISAVEFPVAVHRGENVELHVRSGAAHLRLSAVALADAHPGDPVPLRVGGRDSAVMARATSVGQAVIDTQSPIH